MDSTESGPWYRIDMIHVEGGGGDSLGLYWNFPSYDTNSRNDINFCTETGCDGTSVAFLGKMDCRQYDVLHCYNI